MNSIARGSEAELIVAAEATKIGYMVCLPISHSSCYDLVIDNGYNLLRIQVKRAYPVNNHGKQVLCVETRRILVKHSGNKGSVTRCYPENSYDFLVGYDPLLSNFWIIPFLETKKYKAQIYLSTSKMEVFKNNWSLLS